MPPHDTPRQRRARWTWRVLALLLLPLLLAGTFVAATDGATARADRVQAAVVNLDHAVEIAGQLTPLGRQLASELVTTEGANVTWVLSDAEGAAEGLRDGSYAAVVTIPESFTADAMSFATSPDHVRRARVDVERSQRADALDPALASFVAVDATHRLNTFLSENYLSQVYEGMSTQGEQLASVGKGARDLADGAAQLRTGLDEAAAGSTAYVAGVGQAAAGARELARGVGATPTASTRP